VDFKILYALEKQYDKHRRFNITNIDNLNKKIHEKIVMNASVYYGD